MNHKGGNPFEQGQQDALAGRPWKACPYADGSREHVRYVSGYQAGLIAKRKAQEAAQAQAQPAAQPQQLALEVPHGAVR